jgi:hypothetical protein
MDKEKKLRMMVFWLFGTFLIIFTGATVYTGQWTGLLIMREWKYWAAMGAVAVLCVVAYYVYKAILDRKDAGGGESAAEE